MDENTDMDDVDRALWEGYCQLCEAIIIVIHGASDNDNSSPNNDTLTEREKAAVSVINTTMELVQGARKSFSSVSVAGGHRVCQLLPRHIVSFYVLFETVARLFALFCWGNVDARPRPHPVH